MLNTEINQDEAVRTRSINSMRPMSSNPPPPYDIPQFPRFSMIGTRQRTTERPNEESHDRKPKIFQTVTVKQVGIISISTRARTGSGKMPHREPNLAINCVNHFTMPNTTLAPALYRSTSPVGKKYISEGLINATSIPMLSSRRRQQLVNLPVLERRRHV